MTRQALNFDKADSVRKKCCADLLDSHPKLGMHFCQHQGRDGTICGKQWYVFADGWAKKWGTDRVYHGSSYMGSPTGYGELAKLIRRTMRREKALVKV
jgi:hypothetical protein